MALALLQSFVQFFFNDRRGEELCVPWDAVVAPCPRRVPRTASAVERQLLPQPVRERSADGPSASWNLPGSAGGCSGAVGLSIYIYKMVCEPKRSRPAAERTTGLQPQ